MATITINVCDVLSTRSKELEQYRVVIQKPKVIDGQSKWDDHKVFPQKLLCPKAYERLSKKIQDGISPPTRRQRTATEPPETEAVEQATT